MSPQSCSRPTGGLSFPRAVVLRKSLAWAAPLLMGFAALFCSLPASRATAPTPVRVAAAADLKYCVEEIVPRFNQEHPDSPASVTFGSSGNFFTQIQNGAPFDLFLSADVQYPKKLAEAGMAACPVFVYGNGRLVVWAPNSLATNGAKSGLQILLNPAVRKIAIANPDHAPYGRAAVAALKNNSIYEQVSPKLVFGENIAQAAQFAQSGAADAGILALSLALSPGMRAAGNYWELPQTTYPKMEQGGVVLKSANNTAAAEQFRDCLLKGWGREVLKKNGFVPPEE